MTTNRRKVRVCCLPSAALGRDMNPYQTLMMEGLWASGVVEAIPGHPGKVFAAVRTVLRHRPAWLHYDWNYSYFVRRWPPLSWASALLFLLDVALARALGTRVVWTLHNVRSHEARQPRLERWVQRGFARMCTWIRVMWPSSVERGAAYLGVDRGRFRVVRMGPYHDRYPNTVGRDQARRALGLGAGERVLLHLGVMRGNKGVDDLVAAFRALDEPRARLVIVGPSKPPEYGTRLANRVADDPRVLVVPQFVAEDRVQLYLNAADAVVLPFAQIENSSSVVLAMGFGRAIVAPALGVLPEQLAHQGDLLYPAGELGPALERLVALPQARLDQAGRQNRRAAEATRWEDFAELFAPAPAPCPSVEAPHRGAAV